MLSLKLMRLEKFLALAAAAQVSPPLAAVRAALRIATDCRHQAEHLEGQVIPRRQRLDDEHLRSGKVTLFPVIPRDGATQ